jgi:hypothetical protein
MSDNPVLNMKNETFCLQQEGLEQEGSQIVLRAAGETETTQENIQDWLQLDEGDTGFQLLTYEEIVAVIFLNLFSSELLVLLHFPFICFLRFFRPIVASLIRIGEGSLYSQCCYFNFVFHFSSSR